MKKKHILVVEDERIVAENIHTMLESLGYGVSGVASSGKEAIKKAKEMQPDLVLMDIKLKGDMDGVEAAKKIHDLLNIPVVYLTAHADDKTLQRAKITEPFGYILKPFEDRDLHTTIEMAIHNHNKRIELKENEERYRGVVESVHDAIYIITPDGFQYANPAFEKLTGFKEKELCNNEFDLGNIIHPDDRDLLKEREKAKKRRKEVINREEFRIISKDGGEKIVEASTVNIGKEGEVKEIGILRDITDQKQTEEKSKQSSERLRRALEETVSALASAVEMRDPYTAGHQQRVANLACAIAKEMGLSAEQIDGVRMAGVIHDIGKMIQIPGEIHSKSSQLTEIELNMIKLHPQVGYDLIKTIEFQYPVAQVVLQHHELLDGSGYPAGLSGVEILLEARILTVADVVEVMTSRQPCRPTLGIGAALKEVTNNRGVLYDPEVVDACLKLFAEKGFRFE